jgi:hypothetical protein
MVVMDAVVALAQLGRVVLMCDSPMRKRLYQRLFTHSNTCLMTDCYSSVICEVSALIRTAAAHMFVKQRQNQQQL